MDWGAVIAGAIGGGGNAVGDLAQQTIETNRKRDLMQAQSDMEIAKERASRDYALQLQRDEQQRVGGIYQQGYNNAPGTPAAGDGVGPPAPATSSQSMLGGADALRASGRMADASAVESSIDKGYHNTPGGSITTNLRDGSTIDNSYAKTLTAQAAMLRAQNGGSRKAISQDDLIKTQQLADKLVDQQTTMPHPYSTAFTPEERAKDTDTARAHVLKDRLGTAIANAAAQGTMLDPAGALHSMQPVVKQADLMVQKEANVQAAKIFDAKGAPQADKIAALQADTNAPQPPPYALTNAVSFKRWFRDENLGTVFDRIASQGRGAPQAAPAQAAPQAATPDTRAAGASAAQQAAPPTAAPVAADRYRGSSFEQNQRMGADAASARDAALSDRIVVDKQRTDAEQDPELQRWMQASRQFLAKGRSVDANSALTRYKQLRQQRYNF